MRGDGQTKQFISGREHRMRIASGGQTLINRMVNERGTLSSRTETHRGLHSTT
jgi:hypothetical protein